MYECGKCICDGCGTEILADEGKEILTLGREIIGIFGSRECIEEAKELIIQALLMRRVLLKSPPMDCQENARYCRWCQTLVEDDKDHEHCEEDYADPVAGEANWN